MEPAGDAELPLCSDFDRDSVNLPPHKSGITVSYGHNCDWWFVIGEKIQITLETLGHYHQAILGKDFMQ